MHSSRGARAKALAWWVGAMFTKWTSKHPARNKALANQIKVKTKGISGYQYQFSKKTPSYTVNAVGKMPLG